MPNRKTTESCHLCLELFQPWFLGTLMICTNSLTATTPYWTASVRQCTLCWLDRSVKSGVRLILDAEDSTGIPWVWCLQSRKCLCSPIYAHLWSAEINNGCKFETTYHVSICLVLGISDFISRGINTVSKFETVVSQIQKNERDIDSILQSIEMADLMKFPVPEKSNDLPGKTKRIISLDILEFKLIFLDLIPSFFVFFCFF